MSKFSMKDYDEYLKEEARQDQLQESLEIERNEQTFYNEFDGDWQSYLEEHKHDTEDDSSQYDDYCDYELLARDYLSEDPLDGYPELDDDEDDDCYYPECEDDLDYDDMEEAYDPYGEDPYDGLPELDDGDDDSYYPRCEDDWDYDDMDLIIYENIKLVVPPEELRISRKAVARNRHLNEIKSKKRAQQTAAILKSKYRNFTAGTDYEEFRLYSRSTAATKKATRVSKKL